MAKHFETRQEAIKGWQERTGFSWNFLTALISPVRIFNRNSGRREKELLKLPWYVGTKKERRELHELER